MAKHEQEPRNGSMASSMEELKQLGRQMEKMRDEKELKKDHRVSDPAQLDDAEEVQQREKD
ncbi:hypothetical protein [Paenisporosarcina cavernae]|uniref:Multidrug ABC transporter ATPase n=1 Tax=Paenisporosarcina cavernae TaxID=2320858 RepID=A0A385YTN4_9BACL|nr:hypothetical protein [Paenisporosarcina cavernae]AYC30209.1 multidrug ABC transporter ATPase [Paenisporosarcina cavernae]